MNRGVPVQWQSRRRLGGTELRHAVERGGWRSSLAVGETVILMTPPFDPY